ncbi:MAG: HlyD family efflux transporter periplasmic adaptor subunit [Oligoflexia bacterium]|nr:HlyD family efflux transporter periplasmic adaptor subunit [Oligoflexia bacterium]
MKISSLVPPVLCVVGLAAMAIAVASDRPPGPSPAPTPVAVAQVPYDNYIGGTGRVEPCTGAVAVAAPTAGVIDQVLVKWGQTVTAGQPLMRLQTADLLAKQETARARVREALAAANQSGFLLKSGEQLSDGAIISSKELAARRFAAQADKARLAARRAELGELGAQIELRTLYSPLDGRVLALRAWPGQFAAPGAAPALLVVGDDSCLFVRAQVDESQASRLRPGAPATAFRRSDPSAHAPLEFERIEPMVVPKSMFRGDGTELTDSRVVEVIYRLDPAALPSLVGENLDVYISAPPP